MDVTICSEAAAQRAREAKKAQKQTGLDLRTANRQLQSCPKKQLAAQRAPDNVREPFVIEPVEQGTTGLFSTLSPTKSIVIPFESADRGE